MTGFIDTYSVGSRIEAVRSYEHCMVQIRPYWFSKWLDLSHLIEIKRTEREGRDLTVGS
jgi:hypothetical protein